MGHYPFSHRSDEDVKSSRVLRRHAALDIPPGTKERQLAEVVAYLRGDRSDCSIAGLFSIAVARHEDTQHAEATIGERLHALERTLQVQAGELRAVRSDITELKGMVAKMTASPGPKERLLDELISKLGGPLVAEELDPETLSLIFSPDDE